MFFGVLNFFVMLMCIFGFYEVRFFNNIFSKCILVCVRFCFLVVWLRCLMNVYVKLFCLGNRGSVYCVLLFL